VPAQTVLVKKALAKKALAMRITKRTGRLGAKATARRCCIFSTSI